MVSPAGGPDVYMLSWQPRADMWINQSVCYCEIVSSSKMSHYNL